MLKQSVNINWKGFGWGMMAALSYTASMYSSNNIELHFPPLKRSLYMILGGLLIIVLVFHSSLNQRIFIRNISALGPSPFLVWNYNPAIAVYQGNAANRHGAGGHYCIYRNTGFCNNGNVLLKESVSFLQWVGVILFCLRWC
jgi:hypothetical protein